MKRDVLSISQLVAQIKSTIDQNHDLRSVLVKGEISNFTHHQSGHYYFTLKDTRSRINCVMFSSYAMRCPLKCKEGMKVIASGNVTVYEPYGNCQLYVTGLQLDGLGDLYLQLEEVKKRMYDQGYFDIAHKKIKPEYPLNIAVVSARSGAAIQDVLTTLTRRWPLARVFFYPCLVQGNEAVRDLMNTISYADQQGHDLMLVVRGGGSIEDLWCFNNEALAKLIFQCRTVVISGVGHETDTTLIDYVADYRAPTPTAAAELATPDLQEVIQKVIVNQQRLHQLMSAKLNQAKQQLVALSRNRLLSDPMLFIRNDALTLLMLEKRLLQFSNQVSAYRHQINHLQQRLNYSALQVIKDGQNEQKNLKHRLNQQIVYLLEEKRKSFTQKVQLLDAYSPLKIVERGYSITYHHGHVIRQCSDIGEGDQIITRLKDGNLISKVIEKEEFHEQ